eukprot:753312-Hanusia_phi.AAC.1
MSDGFGRGREGGMTLSGMAEDEMWEIAKKAGAKGLITYVVMDAGRTQIAAGSRTVGEYWCVCCELKPHVGACHRTCSRATVQGSNRSSQAAVTGGRRRGRGRGAGPRVGRLGVDEKKAKRGEGESERGLGGGVESKDEVRSLDGRGREGGQTPDTREEGREKRNSCLTEHVELRHKHSSIKARDGLYQQPGMREWLPAVQ